MGEMTQMTLSQVVLKRHSEESHRWRRHQLCLGAANWEGNGEGFSEGKHISWRAHKCMHGNGRNGSFSCITNCRKTYWQNNHLLCGWLGSEQFLLVSLQFQFFNRYREYILFLNEFWYFVSFKEFILSKLPDLLTRRCSHMPPYPINSCSFSHDICNLYIV